MTISTADVGRVKQESRERIINHGYPGVIKELVSNAWDAIRSRADQTDQRPGRVFVTYARDEEMGHGMIIVADDGAGMTQSGLSLPYDMSFCYGAAGSTVKGGKFNVGSKSWASIAQRCTYISRSSTESPWSGVFSTTQDIETARKQNLSHIPHTRMSAADVSQRMRDLSASYDFVATRSQKKNGEQPKKYSPLGCLDILSGTGTIVIYEGVGAKELQAPKGAPDGRTLISHAAFKIGMHFSRQINSGQMIVEVAHLGLSGDRLKDSPGTRDVSHRTVKGVAQIRDLAPICPPIFTQVIPLGGGEAVTVTGWACDADSQAILKRKGGVVGGLTRMEVIRTGGDNNPDVVKENWGGENPTFGRWLPCQGVDIIRNDEYVATVRVPGVKQHPTDNYCRIEVEYVAGPLTEQAIDITANRMNANIASSEVEDACAQAYREYLRVKADVKSSPKPASASKAAANAASSDLMAQLEALRQENEEMKRESAARSEEHRELKEMVLALLGDRRSPGQSAAALT